MENYLIDRNNPIITTGINKAKSHKINELRKVYPQNEDENMITFVHTYNPHHPNIFNVVQESRLILKGSPAMKMPIDSSRLISSKLQPPNLKRILTKAAFDDKPFKGEVNKCDKKRCGCCKFLQTGNSFFFDRAGINFNIKFDMTCSTENLLYVLTCMGCNEYYVGPISNALRDRNRVHKQQVLHPDIANCQASRHIDRCESHLPISYKIMLFFKMYSPHPALQDPKIYIYACFLRCFLVVVFIYFFVFIFLFFFG